MIIKGKTSEQWKSWLENELKPPQTADKYTVYVLEAFLELINKSENHGIKRTRKRVGSSKS